MPDRLRCGLIVGLSVVLLTGVSTSVEAQGVDAGEDQVAGRFAALALDCVHRDYPNKISHVLNSDADARVPRELTPAFSGCFDWHSSVHGHWLLVRLARAYPEADFAEPALAAVGASLTVDNLTAEAEYLAADGRRGFERPYGLAWLLQLAAELRQWDSPRARSWSEALAPLEAEAVRRLAEWIPKLTHPIRIGEHSQTAFAFGLIYDWARVAGDDEMQSLLKSRARDFYLADQECPLAYEPSGHDFLSPCIAEADFMRRVLPPAEFGQWLSDFLPGLMSATDGTWLPPAVVSDRSDGKLAHLDGLNLSRAWMLEGIVSGLQEDDRRRESLTVAAQAHREAGLAAVTGEHYAGGHWLGSFATYLVTGRGLSIEPER